MTSDALIFDPSGGIPRLLAIMDALRDPERGCPWDAAQTWDTIAPYTIEEAYEVADAIDRRAWGDLKGELGDLLLQVVYFAQMGREEGRFDFAAICDAISDKMVARHPHVFGDESRDKTADDQVLDWEKTKAAERQGKGERRTLDGVALALPALTRALKLQNRAARVGFDWSDVDQVLAKVAEEMQELAEARASDDADAIEDEFGDILFVLTNVGRHLGVDPERALRRTNAKFTRRFEAIEDALAAEGSSPAQASLDRMEELWGVAKTQERRGT